MKILLNKLSDTLQATKPIEYYMNIIEIRFQSKMSSNLMNLEKLNQLIFLIFFFPRKSAYDSVEVAINNM